MAIRIALWASGSGSNAENIVRFFRNDSRFEFPVIISNKSTALVHERALKLGIPSVTFTRDDFADGQKVLDFHRECGIDCIVLAGFLLKVPDEVTKSFPDRIINIHPSLLPKYGGRGMYGQHVHEAVAAAGESESGITIHYINEHYDEGNVIFQTTCSLLPTDTPEMIAEKVHALEYEFYPKIIEQLWGNHTDN